MAEFSVTHSFAAAPERVFDAWLDPAIARRFLFATRDGEMIRAEVDPKVGGQFTFVDRRPEMGDVLHTGEYLEIDRPRRLAFTFAVPQFDPGFTRVLVEIAATSDGGCQVTLTQSDVPAEWAEGSKQGWGMILDWLEAVLTS
jgi:uncharacterized protein YndB with AHSA1/START domain